MRGISELSKSLSRASSTNPASRPTILTEKSGDDLNPVSESQQPTPKAEKAPTPSRSADNLFAMVDALASAPSQDISRPFDAIPPPRASESKSWSKSTKHRRSVVSTLPPTVDTLGESLTPFSDGFKLFVQEPVPRRPGSPSTSVIPSLVSNTTLDDPEVPSIAYTSLSASDAPASVTAAPTPKKPEQPAAIPQTPPPSKDGFFRGLLRVVQIKRKASSYVQPQSSDKSDETHHDKTSTNSSTKSTGATLKPSVDGANDVSSSMNGYEEKNTSNSSLGRGFGSFRRLGRRSRDLKESTPLASPLSAKFPNMDKEPSAPLSISSVAPVAERKSAEVDSDAPLQPPPAITKPSEDGRSSPRYSHGVLLHPIAEDERTEEGK